MELLATPYRSLELPRREKQDPAFLHDIQVHMEHQHLRSISEVDLSSAVDVGRTGHDVLGFTLRTHAYNRICRGANEDNAFFRKSFCKFSVLTQESIAKLISEFQV